MGYLPAGQEEAGRAIVRRALALGIRYMDTAPQYGYGEAEHRLGEVMPEIDRTALVLSTKVGRRLRPATLTRRTLRLARRTVKATPGAIRGLARRGGATAEVAPAADGGSGVSMSGGTPRHRGSSLQQVVDFSYDGIMRSVEQSLERLGTDHADILLLHEPEGPIGPVMDGGYRALERLRADGRVGAIGIGLNEVAPLIEYIEAGDFDCFLLGLRYTLMDQTAAARLLPLAAERGVGVIVGGVFNSGILADPKPGASFDYHKARDADVRRAVRLRDVCADHGVALKAAALQFAFQHPAVTSVLTGVVSVDELEENAAAFEASIPADLWDDLRAQGLVTDR